MKVLLLALLSMSAQAADQPLGTVSYVDLNRYMGKWYEIASFPQRFQKDCTATQAEYSLQSGGRVSVVNSCRLKTLDGELKIAKGSAYVDDKTTNAKLKVTFFWPFYGDYWILDLGDQYEYVMVGAPDRDYLWFLARTRTLDSVTYGRLLEKARDLGFDVSRLKTTLQPQE